MYLAVSLAVFVVAWTFFVRRVDLRTAASLGLAVAVTAAVCVPLTILVLGEPAHCRRAWRR